MRNRNSPMPLVVLVSLSLMWSHPAGAQDEQPPPDQPPDSTQQAAEPKEGGAEDEEVGVEDEEVGVEDISIDEFDELELSPVDPGEFTDQEMSLILLDSVVHEDSWWSVLDVGVSIYDPRRDVIIARWTPGISLGRRFSSYGFFGTVQFDQSLDFTLDLSELSVLNVGVGAEYLSFLGHVRSTFMVGTSILLTRTPIDEPGEVGWFIELRPGSLRWAMGESLTFEFSPIALDIIAPVTEGIPLVIYSYSTLLAVEWTMSE